ncbi:hypothetical protein PTI98_002873 [Pleurotus ostreatus]|nr:hypothetical protein PTI98_002873 [Pleurotus ostreatus]
MSSQRFHHGILLRATFIMFTLTLCMSTPCPPRSFATKLLYRREYGFIAGWQLPLSRNLAALIFEQIKHKLSIRIVQEYGPQKQ